LHVDLLRIDVLFSFSAKSSVSSGKKHKVGCTVQHPQGTFKKSIKQKSSVITTLDFLVGAGGLREPRL